MQQIKQDDQPLKQSRYVCFPEDFSALHQVAEPDAALLFDLTVDDTEKQASVAFDLDLSEVDE